MNPYESFVNDWAKLFQSGKSFPLGNLPKPVRVTPAVDAPKALIFSPHPDDEVIIGGFALRLLRELRWNVINVAVTQGSNKKRQQERWQELAACCEYIGFGLERTRENGLEGINPKNRLEHRDEWQQSVGRIAEMLAAHRPRLIFLPHAEDWNSSHIGTHYLVVDALTSLGGGFSCLAVETEFWGAMAAPNLMVESSQKDVIDLISALSFHVGEVRRNPYHLRMPAWLMDNVRRGGELVGGQGTAAPDFLFATLYRLRVWQNGGFHQVWAGGKSVGQGESLAAVGALVTGDW